MARAQIVANDNDSRLAAAAAHGRRMAEEMMAELRTTAASRLATVEMLRKAWPDLRTDTGLLEALATAVPARVGC